MRCEGQWCWRSQETCLDGRLQRWLTLWLPLWISLSLSLPRFALTAVLSGFLISYVFSTCMPHYILKVNPTNAEITLEDKLPRGLSFWPDCPLHWVPGFHFPSTVSTPGSSCSNFIRFDKANSLFSIKDIGLKQRTNERTEKCADLFNPFEMCVIFRFILSVPGF